MLLIGKFNFAKRLIIFGTSLLIVALTSTLSLAGAGYAENLNVPPKDEWRICEKDDDCDSFPVDCNAVHESIAFNRKFRAEYSKYREERCNARTQTEGSAQSCLFRGPQPVKCLKSWWEKLIYW